VRLPYAGGRLQMYLFLPDTNSSPAKLLADLNADTWRDKILPKFQDEKECFSGCHGSNWITT
jgi:serine protease inhibitor